MSTHKHISHGMDDSTKHLTYSIYDYSQTWVLENGLSKEETKEHIRSSSSNSSNVTIQNLKDAIAHYQAILFQFRQTNTFDSSIYSTILAKNMQHMSISLQEWIEQHDFLNKVLFSTLPDQPWTCSSSTQTLNYQDDYPSTTFTSDNEWKLKQYLQADLPLYRAIAYLYYKQPSIHSSVSMSNVQRLCGTTDAAGCLRGSGGDDCYGYSESYMYLDKWLNGDIDYTPIYISGDQVVINKHIHDIENPDVSTNISRFITPDTVPTKLLTDTDTYDHAVFSGSNTTDYVINHGETFTFTPITDEKNDYVCQQTCAVHGYRYAHMQIDKTKEGIHTEATCTCGNEASTRTSDSNSNMIDIASYCDTHGKSTFGCYSFDPIYNSIERTLGADCDIEHSTDRGLRKICKEYRESNDISFDAATYCTRHPDDRFCTCANGETTAISLLNTWKDMNLLDASAYEILKEQWDCWYPACASARNTLGVSNYLPEDHEKLCHNVTQCIQVGTDGSIGILDTEECRRIVSGGGRDGDDNAMGKTLILESLRDSFVKDRTDMDILYWTASISKVNSDGTPIRFFDMKEALNTLKTIHAFPGNVGYQNHVNMGISSVWSSGSMACQPHLFANPNSFFVFYTQKNDDDEETILKRTGQVDQTTLALSSSSRFNSFQCGLDQTWDEEKDTIFTMTHEPNESAMPLKGGARAFARFKSKTNLDNAIANSDIDVQAITPVFKAVHDNVYMLGSPAYKIQLNINLSSSVPGLNSMMNFPNNELCTISDNRYVEMEQDMNDIQHTIILNLEMMNTTTLAQTFTLKLKTKEASTWNEYTKAIDTWTLDIPLETNVQEYEKKMVFNHEVFQWFISSLKAFDSDIGDHCESNWYESGSTYFKKRNTDQKYSMLIWTFPSSFNFDIEFIAYQSMFIDTRKVSGIPFVLHWNDVIKKEIVQTEMNNANTDANTASTTTWSSAISDLSDPINDLQYAITNTDTSANVFLNSGSTVDRIDGCTVMNFTTRTNRAIEDGDYTQYIIQDHMNCNGPTRCGLYSKEGFKNDTIDQLDTFMSILFVPIEFSKPACVGTRTAIDAGIEALYTSNLLSCHKDAYTPDPISFFANTDNMKAVQNVQSSLKYAPSADELDDKRNAVTLYQILLYQCRHNGCVKLDGDEEELGKIMPDGRSLQTVIDEDTAFLKLILFGEDGFYGFLGMPYTCSGGSWEYNHILDWSDDVDDSEMFYRYNKNLALYRMGLYMLLVKNPSINIADGSVQMICTDKCTLCSGGGLCYGCADSTSYIHVITRNGTSAPKPYIILGDNIRPNYEMKDAGGPYIDASCEIDLVNALSEETEINGTTTYPNLSRVCGVPSCPSNPNELLHTLIQTKDQVFKGIKVGEDGTCKDVVSDLSTSLKWASGTALAKDWVNQSAYSFESKTCDELDCEYDCVEHEGKAYCVSGTNPSTTCDPVCEDPKTCILGTCSLPSLDTRPTNSDTQKYILYDLLGEKCMSASVDGTMVEMKVCDKEDEKQQWLVNGSGISKLKNVSTGTCMDPDGDTTKLSDCIHSGTNMIMSEMSFTNMSSEAAVRTMFNGHTGYKLMFQTLESVITNDEDVLPISNVDCTPDRFDVSSTLVLKDGVYYVIGPKYSVQSDGTVIASQVLYTTNIVSDEICGVNISEARAWNVGDPTEIVDNHEAACAALNHQLPVCSDMFRWAFVPL